MIVIRAKRTKVCGPGGTWTNRPGYYVIESDGTLARYFDGERVIAWGPGRWDTFSFSGDGEVTYE